MKLRRKKGESDSDYRNIELKQSEERTKDSLARELEGLRKLVRLGFIPNDPTYTFEVGEEVQYGAVHKTVVLEVIDDGTIYLVSTRSDYRNDPRKNAEGQKLEVSKGYKSWLDLRKKITKEEHSKIPVFTEEDNIRLNYYQTGMTHFWSVLYYFGVNMNPDYQRDLVWELKDKVKLIDSIFHNVDIGKFVFRSLEYKESYEKNEKGYTYEIIDGKQRLTAIKEFYEDRFKYKGRTFSELNLRDKAHFDTYSISCAEVKGATDQQIYKLFVRLNTGGKAVSEEQINKVKNLIKE